MTDDAKTTAWREYCQKLEAIGVDPYAPNLPDDYPRHEQVVGIVADYHAETTHKLSLPKNWEGHDPVQPVNSLPDLAEWLSFQWRLIKAGELAGERAKQSTLSDASRAIRNGFRVLEWLDVDNRPERPVPAESLEVAKQQIDNLERWIRKKHKSGWKPSLKKVKPLPTADLKKHPKRNEILDDYEANIRIKQFLDSNPKATVKQVANATGISTGRISGLDAWKRAMAERKAAKPSAKKSERPLTKKMLLSKGTDNDPAEIAIYNDAVWRWLIEKAEPKQKVELHMKTPEQQATLIELAREQYEEEMSGVKD